MIDFKLTGNGDIAIDTATQYPTCHLDFFIKPYPCLRLDFDTDIAQYDTGSYGIKFEFNTDLHNLSNDKKTAQSITDKAETAQEILIRLKTEQGEFTALPALGSKLVLERHENIHSDAIREMVRQHTEEAITDVTFDATPAITVTRADDESRFRHETLKITIDTENTTYFEDTI